MMVQTTQTLFDALRQKRDCCLALIELAKKQQTLIGSGDLGPLLEVLAAKQRIMGRMEEVQRRLTFPDSPSPQSWRENLDSETQRRCHDVLEQTEHLLADLLGIEKQCEQALVQLREAAALQLRQTDAGRQVNRAYLKQTAPSTNRLVDLEAD